MNLNERIEKLIAKSKLENLDGFAQYEIDAIYNLVELIIQECGVALSPMLRDMVSRGQAYDLIKQHFGVE